MQKMESKAEIDVPKGQYKPVSEDKAKQGRVSSPDRSSSKGRRRGVSFSQGGPGPQEENAFVGRASISQKQMQEL